MYKSPRIIRIKKLGQYRISRPNTRKTGPIREKSANMKMTSFNVLFQKKLAAMFSSASPIINCNCICNLCCNCSCIYRIRNNRQQLSLIKRIYIIQTTIFTVVSCHHRCYSRQNATFPIFVFFVLRSPFWSMFVMNFDKQASLFAKS